MRGGGYDIYCRVYKADIALEMLLLLLLLLWVVLLRNSAI